MLIKIKIKSLLFFPKKATLSSSGYDLVSNLEKSHWLGPGDRFSVPVGISIAFSDGFEAQIRPRSGLAIKHGITVLNSPGTIDADYRGEIHVILINLGKERFEIKSRMKVAQIVFNKTVKANFKIVKKLPKSVRSLNGFGSTGI